MGEEEEKEKEKERQKEKERIVKATSKLDGPKQVGKIDLDKGRKPKKQEPKKENKPQPQKQEKPEPETKKPVASSVKKDTESTPSAPKEDRVETKYQKLDGPNFTGQKID